MTILRTIEDLSGLLEIGLKELCLLIGNADNSYVSFRIPKRSGKKRIIDAPQPLLKNIQRCLLDRLLYQKMPHQAVHGFVPGKSIVSNARCHTGRQWVATLDIQDFFPSTTSGHVRQVLAQIPSIAPPVVESICRLVTRNDRLPQGAPTSPHLANLAFYDADRALTRLAGEYRLVYTRYADDLAFSGNEKPDGLPEDVGAIVLAHGYRLAEDKTKITGRHRRQLVTGLVVNDGVRLPRELRRKLRAIMNEIRTTADFGIFPGSLCGTEEELQGYLSLLAMVEQTETKGNSQIF